MRIRKFYSVAEYELSRRYPGLIFSDVEEIIAFLSSLNESWARQLLSPRRSARLAAKRARQPKP